jgi:uncharacterized protein YqgC (DUF456 family)
MPPESPKSPRRDGGRLSRNTVRLVLREGSLGASMVGGAFLLGAVGGTFGEVTGHAGKIVGIVVGSLAGVAAAVWVELRAFEHARRAR